ncbi:MAG: glycosyltransferase [Pirellulales bacterium]|nr:glycosyltransferase [Pirellulales bacterium]
MKANPTVCQLLHGLTVGGAEVLAARLARRLRDRYQFVFFCLEERGPLGEELRDEGFPVEVVGRHPGIDPRCMRRLARLWRQHRVALVHAHQYTPFFYALAARLGTTRPPVLFTEHGRWFPDYPRRRRIVFNRLMLRHRDRVVAVGESVRQALIHNEGIRPDRVAIVYNGVDGGAFAPHDADRAAIRRELGLDENDLVVIQVARLDHLKDHCTAVRTAQRVAKVQDRLRLLLVGEGPERQTIMSEIETRGVGRHVRLLGLRHDVARLLSAADLFLLTSISEGIPVTVIEAMAAGVPVVATSVGGLSEMIEPGETGLLASSGNDEALAEAILRLADDAALRETIRRQARAKAEAVFSERAMHAAYEACYEEMLGE